MKQVWSGRWCIKCDHTWDATWGEKPCGCHKGEEELNQLRECLWWCYDNERFGWEIDEQMWEVIGRLLGADTDHNDNEWSEEE